MSAPATALHSHLLIVNKRAVGRKHRICSRSQTTSQSQPPSSLFLFVYIISLRPYHFSRVKCCTLFNNAETSRTPFAATRLASSPSSTVQHSGLSCISFPMIRPTQIHNHEPTNRRKDKQIKTNADGQTHRRKGVCVVFCVEGKSLP